MNADMPSQLRANTRVLRFAVVQVVTRSSLVGPCITFYRLCQTWNSSLVFTSASPGASSSSGAWTHPTLHPHTFAIKSQWFSWPLCLPVHSARMHKPCASKSWIDGLIILITNIHCHSTFIEHSPTWSCTFIYHLWLCSQTAKLKWHVAQLPTATLEEIHRPAQGNYRSIWHLERWK